jgi:(p)ppGpp synthase/HD superfamily hydrolase
LEDSTCYLRAHELAAQIHEGQTDKAGRPYIERCERVARNLMRRWPEASKDEIQAALLHDVIEDGTDQHSSKLRPSSEFLIARWRSCAD